MTPDELCDALGAARLLPVIRVPTADDALAMCTRLVGAGLGVLELTVTTEGWPSALVRARESFPQAVVGMGTVLDAHVTEAAVAAGASFLVSPYPAPAVRPVAAAAGVAFLEGGFTPAEIGDAAGRGPAKVFPAHLGGPRYLRSLLSVLPGSRLVPTGGIRLAEVTDWLAAGALAVGVGSDLTAPGDVGERVRAALGGTS